MGLFILFMIALGFYMISATSNDSLISANYYEEGVNYNATYDAEKNVVVDGFEPTIDTNDKQLVVAFKTEADYKLNLLYVADRKKDMVFKGKTINKQILLNRADLPKGNCILQLSWKYQGKNYLVKKNILL